MARLHLDENLTPLLRRFLADRDHDVTRTDDPYRVGTPAKGTPDHRQLWYATTEGAILVTVDARNFALLDDAWHLWGVARPHPGIIALAPFAQGDSMRVATAIDDLVRHPGETLARQVRGGVAIPSTNGDGTLADRFYYYRADGYWTDVPPRSRR